MRKHRILRVVAGLLVGFVIAAILNRSTAGVSALEFLVILAVSVGLVVLLAGRFPKTAHH